MDLYIVFRTSICPPSGSIPEQFAYTEQCFLFPCLFFFFFLISPHTFPFSVSPPYHTYIPFSKIAQGSKGVK